MNRYTLTLLAAALANPGQATAQRLDPLQQVQETRCVDYLAELDAIAELGVQNVSPARVWMDGVFLGFALGYAAADPSNDDPSRTVLEAQAMCQLEPNYSVYAVVSAVATPPELREVAQLQNQISNMQLLFGFLHRCSEEPNGDRRLSCFDLARGSIERVTQIP